MPNRVSDAANYAFTGKDKLCFDTNIWLNLFPPTLSWGKSKWAASDAGTFKRIKQSQAAIVIDVSVLSEYFNRLARLEWETYRKNPGSGLSFKNFRNSIYFKPAAEAVALLASKIIAQCQQTIQPIALHNFDITHILDDYRSAKCDFTDSVLAENCRVFGYSLFTNDADFCKIDYGIDIITHNPALFQCGFP